MGAQPGSRHWVTARKLSGLDKGTEMPAGADFTADETIAQAFKDKPLRPMWQTLKEHQIASLKSLFKERAGDEFRVRINAVQNIDWGSDAKRLGFRSEVL